MKLKLTLLLSVVLLSMNFALGQVNWTTDFDGSLTKAKAEKKPLLVLFTGSDWCPPCKMLHKKIFESKEFEEYAKDNIVLVKADFPKRKKNKLSPELQKNNQELARKFGVRGFPTVLILDNDGKVIDKKVGHTRLSVEEYINEIKKKAKLI